MNPTDVIDEEDLEESMGAPSSIKKSPNKGSRNTGMSQVKMKSLGDDSRSKGQNAYADQRRTLISRGSRDTNGSKLSQKSVKSPKASSVVSNKNVQSKSPNSSKGIVS